MVTTVAEASGTPPTSGSAPPLAALLVGYAAALGLVGVAGLLAFVVEHIVSQANLPLVFVLPVVVAAAAYGWGPSLLAAAAGIATFDFFFTEPRMTFVVSSPNDLWAMALLLLVGIIVSVVAGESRRRAFAARRAVDQAEALHDLARTIVNKAPPAAQLRAAARALGRAFDAPAIILEVRDRDLALVAADRGGRPTAGDLEAAAWTSANHKPSRAGTYPFGASEYDFWPATSAAQRLLVLGVRQRNRPADADRLAEMVAGYLGESAA